MALAIWIAVFSVYAYWMGYCAEGLRTVFRVVDEKYAIVHENDKYYYLTEFEAGVIHRETQKIIEKGNIEFMWQNVDEVK